MEKLNKDQLAHYGLIGTKSSKYQGIKEDKPRKHEESNLHATFCRWVRKEYPELQFVRHEREKKRGWLMQNLFKVFNGDIDKLPDFELLHWSMVHAIQGKLYYRFSSLYIEFKKPGEKWLTKEGFVKPAYVHQYKCHQHLWSIGRCAYFCNDLEMAKQLLIDYLAGNPWQKQDYQLPVDYPGQLPF